MVASPQWECTYVKNLCSPGPMFPALYGTGEHRTPFLNKGPMFPAFPQKGPMFPALYVTGEHRIFFFKKGPMFPAFRQKDPGNLEPFF